jgi:UDP-N-acetylglucosamine--N-acetylmuramyl-(pentapeptide) pyrophosphoryl-undecaprenol N-acetylglucosamine transferase
LKKRPLTLVFAGGGTGGHLYPAIAIADEIKRRLPSASITFAGTSRKIEARVVPQKGYPFSTIWISGFRRKLSPDLLLFPVKVVVAFAQSVVLMLRLRPDAVIGTGGYVCGPVVFAAQMLGIPTLVQEQNGVPGETTRILAPRATEVHVTFALTKSLLRRHENVFVTGTPVRKLFGAVPRSEAANVFGLDPGSRTLLIFGGSLGASSINRALLPAVPGLVARGIQVIWQTGEQEYASVARETAGFGKHVIVQKFFDTMEAAFAASDLAVCRSGASSLSELCAAGLPSVLIPYPHAAADHQTKNAEVLRDAGAALLVADVSAAAELPGIVSKLIDDVPRLQVMSQNARSLGKPEATSLLADAVLRIAGKNI